MQGDHDPNSHKVFKGADLEALKPWVASFNQLVPGVNAAIVHALTSGDDPHLRMADDIASFVLGKPIRRQEPSLVLCPSTLRKAPMLLRELADLYEDLMKQTGVENTPAWTPNASGKPE